MGIKADFSQRASNSVRFRAQCENPFFVLAVASGITKGIIQWKRNSFENEACFLARLAKRGILKRFARLDPARYRLPVAATLGFEQQQKDFIRATSPLSATTGRVARHVLGAVDPNLDLFTTQLGALSLVGDEISSPSEWK